MNGWHKGEGWNLEHPAQWYTVKSQHQLWYVMASLVSSSLKNARLIFIWPPGSLQGCLPWHGCLDHPDLSDIEDTDDEVDTVLLSLSILWSDESKGYWGGATHNSHCLWPLFWPCCGMQPCSCCPCWGPSWGTSHHSAVNQKVGGSSPPRDARKCDLAQGCWVNWWAHQSCDLSHVCPFIPKDWGPCHSDTRFEWIQGGELPG